MNRRIHIIDDEADMIKIASDLLQSDGYVVDSSLHPAEGLKKLRANPPDLLILDLRLPDMDGYQVCREMKSEPRLKNIPIMMVSAKSDETDVVVGLEVGAEDYMIKPFRKKELLARVKTILRRRFHDEEPPKIVHGPLTLDEASFCAFLNGKSLDLTPREYQLLSYFVKMAGRVLTRAKIYESVWGVNFAGSSRTIDVHVDQLRKKLGKKSEWITTLKGIGYRFKADDKD